MAQPSTSTRRAQLVRQEACGFCTLTEPRFVQMAVAAERFAPVRLARYRDSIGCLTMVMPQWVAWIVQVELLKCRDSGAARSLL
jgi:hypothetical protein